MPRPLADRPPHPAPEPAIAYAAGGGDLVWLALGMRVVLVGIERVLLKSLGKGRPPEETAFLFFGVAVICLLPLASRDGPLSWSVVRYAVPSGLIYAVAFRFYTAALSEGDVTLVAPLGSANVPFILLLAALVHGEGLGVWKVIGTALIALGAVGLESGRGLWGRTVQLLRRPAARAMLTYALLLAVSRMLDKAGASGQVPAAQYALCVFATVALTLGLWLALTRRGGLGRALRHGLDRWAVALGAGACNGYSLLLLIGLLRRVPVSVAEPLTAASLLVSALGAWLWYREPVRARLLPTLAVIAGTWVLAGAVPHEVEVDLPGS